MFIGDRCARVWGLLWHGDFKLRLSIPDSIIFCNGAFHSYLFSSSRHRGEIRKKKGQLALEQIRESLVQSAEKDAANVTPYVAILQSHDTSLMPVPYTSLPRVLRSLGSLPREYRIAQASFAGVPKRNDEVDLYQVIRAYVHPLHGLRFLTTYRFQGDAPDVHQMTSHAQPQTGAKPRHSIGTVCARFADRYPVLPEERAFYDDPTSHRRDAASAALPAVPDAIARECERITLCVVEWLSRIHGVGCKTLQLEFIQNYSKKLLLHSVVDVIFHPEPTLETTPSIGLQLLAAVDDRGEEKQSESYTNAQMSGAYQSTYTASTAPPHARPTPPSSAAAESSSAAVSRAPSRPASATVRPASASGRAGRQSKAALMSSASSAAFTAPPPQSLTARPSRPASARPRPPAPPAGSATARTSDELEESFRNTQPPRGFVGLASGAASMLPRTSRAKIMRDAEKSGLQFETLMQFETRTEMDDRMSRGGLRPPASGVSVANLDGTPAASAGGRADFLLFHWRSQARSAQDEIVRLNEELEESSRQWQQKETQLMSLLHMEEKKVATLSTQNQTSQMENQALRHELDSLRLSSTQRHLEQETTITDLRKEVDVNHLIIARLEDVKKRHADELLALQGEKGATVGEVGKLKSEKAELARLKQRAEQELTVAQKVRDELLEKLESEEKFARNLAQQLDLMSQTTQRMREMRGINKGARRRCVLCMRSPPSPPAACSSPPPQATGTRWTRCVTCSRRRAASLATRATV